MVLSKQLWKQHELALKVLIILNLIDACATIGWVESELAYEANPLMAHLLSISPSLFLFYKILLVNLGIALLWIYRERAFARLVTIPVVAIYVAIDVYHLVNIIAVYI